MKTSVNEVLLNNGLDFKIIKEPYMRDGKPTNYFGLFNDKTGECLNMVKEGYSVSQNEDVVKMVLAGIEPFGDKLSISKAGSLNGGRKVFLQLGIEGDSKVGSDTVKRYVTIIDSNDGSTSLSIGIGDLCMRCTNQFTKFYKEGDAKFRHTATIEQKIKTIPMLIQTALNESMKQVQLYQKLVSTPVTKRLADEMVKHILGYDRTITSMEVMASKSTRSINIMENLYNDIETEINQVGNNAWALFGGVTRYTTHNMSAPKRDNGRIESQMIGTGYNMNKGSLDFLTKKLELA